MKGCVIVFGEDDNDREVVRELIAALCPSADRLIVKRRRPLLLVKNVRSAEVRRRARDLAAVVRAEEAIRGAVHCVFVHNDADALPPAASTLAKDMRAAAKAEGLDICAVVPGWETEAWFFLFPKAVAHAFPSWRALTVGQRSVDHIANPKEDLRRATARGKSRGYQVGHAPEIARAVRSLGLADSPVGQSESYQRFRECVAQCCARLN